MIADVAYLEHHAFADPALHAQRPRLHVPCPAVLLVRVGRNGSSRLEVVQRKRVFHMQRAAQAGKENLGDHQRRVDRQFVHPEHLGLGVEDPIAPANYSPVHRPPRKAEPGREVVLVEGHEGRAGSQSAKRTRRREIEDRNASVRLGQRVVQLVTNTQVQRELRGDGPVVHDEAVQSRLKKIDRDRIRRNGGGLREPQEEVGHRLAGAAGVPRRETDASGGIGRAEARRPCAKEIHAGLEHVASAERGQGDSPLVVFIRLDQRRAFRLISHRSQAGHREVRNAVFRRTRFSAGGDDHVQLPPHIVLVVARVARRRLKKKQPVPRDPGIDECGGREGVGVRDRRILGARVSQAAEVPDRRRGGQIVLLLVHVARREAVAVAENVVELGYHVFRIQRHWRHDPVVDRAGLVGQRIKVEHFAHRRREPRDGNAVAWKGKPGRRVQERRNRPPGAIQPEVSLPPRIERHVSLQDSRLALAVTLIGHHEECPVPDDRTRSDASELVLTEHRLLRGRECVAGVEFVVAEKLPEGAVELVGSGAEAVIDVRPAEAAELGRVVACPHLEFAHRVDHGNEARIVVQAEIDVGAVDRVLVGGWAHSVRRNSHSARKNAGHGVVNVVGAGGHARAEQRELRDVAAR
ncbi:MAG: hypothetical protein IANPNBLG_01177 [Bryobacteraceae bacterium]|nr:hypothetical protein [Bryobacteraceae bacterium]